MENHSLAWSKNLLENFEWTIKEKIGFKVHEFRSNFSLKYKIDKTIIKMLKTTLGMIEFHKST